MNGGLAGAVGAVVFVWVLVFALGVWLVLVVLPLFVAVLYLRRGQWLSGVCVLVGSLLFDAYIFRGPDTDTGIAVSAWYEFNGRLKESEGDHAVTTGSDRPDNGLRDPSDLPL